MAMLKHGESTTDMQMTKTETPYQLANTENMAYRRNNDEHVADIDKLVSSLTKILEDVPKYICNSGHPGRISRIPTNLREADLKAYEPYFMSFGPYYHGKPRLQNMEKRKQLALKHFLKYKSELHLKDYLSEIQSIEAEARSFYSDVEMESEEFVRMLLLDSIYIVTMFCGWPKSLERMNQDNEEIHENQVNEAIIAEDNNRYIEMTVRTDVDETWMEETTRRRLHAALIMHDLFLLENQLPFFVLEKIYALAYDDHQAQFKDYMKAVIGNMLTDYTTLETDMVISPTEEVHHLLHLCHMFFRPSFQQECTATELLECGQFFRLGSATQLYEAGVKFTARSSSTQHSLLDISFCSSGKMVMPCLHVDDNTNSLLRNLIALEQMKYPNLGLNVSAYAVLLLHLVTIPEDVGLLRKKGIIQHHLASDKEMVQLVNRLSVGLAFDYVEDNYSLKPVFQELKAYSEHKLPRWKTWFKDRHCINPWTTISLFAASLLILLSVVQTYYTVLSYYQFS